MLFYLFFSVSQAFNEHNIVYIGPKEDQLFVNKVYEGSIPKEINLKADKTITEVTGCTFRNINYNSNFFGTSDHQFPFYNNTFEYTENIINPSIMWFSYDGQFTAISCTFKNFRYLKQNLEGILFSANRQLNFRFEKCAFINIGQNETTKYFKLNQPRSKIELLECTFTYDDSNVGSKLCDFKQTDLIINSCTFTRCPKNMIQINQDSSSTGRFTFTNNIVEGNSKIFIDARSMKLSPIINNNIFRDIELVEGYLIYYRHTATEINLFNNTFSNITAKSGTYCGGISSYYGHQSSSQVTLKYEQCYFYNITNMKNGEPYNQGGALQYGYDSGIFNTVVNILSCEFKQNNCVNGKGGSLGININRALTITNCIFESNECKNEGGAIYIWGRKTQTGSFEMNSITITNCEFINNKGSDGSAIYISEENMASVSLVITECNFNNNGEDQSKHMIVSYCGKTTFDHNQVEYTDATKTSGSLSLYSSNEVIITNCIFTNSNVETSSTIILVDQQNNCQTTVTNVSFNNCKCNEHVIKFSGSLVTAEMITISFDSLDISCGGINFASKSFSIRNSNFIKTKSSSGSIRFSQVENQVGSVLIEKCKFDSCNGYSIFIDGNDQDTTFTINDNTFNQITGNPEGICVLLNFLNIVKNVKLDSNSAENCQGTNHIKIAFTSENGNLFTLDSCTFINNSINDKSIGRSGILIQIKPTNCDFVITNCLFERNACLTKGGALFIDDNIISSARSLAFINCIFTENTANEEGGAIIIATDKECSFENCSFIKNESKQKGGAIYINSNNCPEIIKCTFKENVANSGGAISIETKQNYNQNHDCIISSTKFEKNKDTTNSSHAISFTQIEQVQTKLIINNHCTFIDNCNLVTSNLDGYVILSSAAFFEFFDSQIEFSNVLKSTPSISLSGSSTAVINNVYFKFTDCNAASASCILVNPQIAKIEIDSCTFYCCGTNNENRYAVYVKNKLSSINNCTILGIKNDDNYKSGGIKITSSGTHSITYCLAQDTFFNGPFQYDTQNDNSPDKNFIFQHIEADSCRGTDSKAINIVLTKADNVVFENITLRNMNYLKKATFFLDVYGDEREVAFKELRFINNEAIFNNMGGAGFWFRSMNRVFVTYTDCLWQNNYADSNSGSNMGNGGALLLGLNERTSRYDIIMNNCSFIENRAKKSGGALYVNNKYSLIINNCSFIDNRAEQKGGAIYYNIPNQEAKIFSINNCKFINNIANDDGSALYLTSSSQKVLDINDNCEFINSQAGKNVIYSEIEKFFKISNSSFIESDSSKLVRPLYLKKGNPVDIYNIKFINCFYNGDGNAIKTESTVNELNLHDCTFKNCGNQGHAILFQGSNCEIENDTFLCTTNNDHFGGIHIPTNAQSLINNCSFIRNLDDSNSILLADDYSFTGINPEAKSVLLISQQSNNKNQVSITNCVFDGCSNNNLACFNISIKTTSFKFDDNKMKNMKNANYKGYLGVIHCNNVKTSLEINNMEFTNNVGRSLFGGGVGLLFFGITDLKLYDCHFTSNKAKQDTTQSRPKPATDENYYNGDGGGIQLGYLCPLNNINVLFERCEFKGNSAYRHGGAIAIQTFGTVEIKDCLFQENIANDVSINLLDNHYVLKKQGRGGAIYINPTYDSYSSSCASNSYMTKVVINNCTFKSNQAYDGYAIYIEGEEKGTEFSFNNNHFINNYNLETLSKNYSIIASEIHVQSVSYDTVVI